MAMRSNKLPSLLGFPVLFALILVIGWLSRQWILQFFSTSESFRSWISSMGAWAPMVFVLVQAAQVILFFIPGEVPQIAGGYLFGFWLGSLLSLTGIALGSAASFLMARALGLPFLQALFPAQEVEKARRMLDSPRTRIVFFLIFIIPGIPKDILCYAAGLSPLGLRLFLLFSLLGRLPGILGSALIGTAAAGQRWILAGVLFVLSACLFVAGFLLRDRIQAVLEKLYSRKSRGPR